MPGAAGDEAGARQSATRIRSAMDALLKAAPNAGAYVSESDYFQARWEDAYWGGHYARLARVKGAVDPDEQCAWEQIARLGVPCMGG